MNKYISRLGKYPAGTVCVFGLLFLFIVYVSWCTVWHFDEISYSYGFPERLGDILGQPIQSIADIFRFQNQHWFQTNGRYVAHFIVQLCLVFAGKPVFALLNGLMYIAFVCMLLKVSGVSLRSVRSVTTAAIMTLLCFSTGMYPTCQVGYIWMYTLGMCFIYLFFKKIRLTPLRCAGLVALSLLAGNCHESLNIPLGAALLVYVIIHRRDMSASQWIMFACWCVTAALLCLSPGSHSRLDERHNTLFIDFAIMVELCRAEYILAAVLCYAVMARKVRFIGILKDNYFWFIGVAAALLFNIYISVTCNRQLFGMELFCCIIALRVLRRHAFTPFFIIAFTCLIGYISYLQIRFILIQKEEYEQLIYEIETEKRSTVYMDFKDTYRYFGDFSYSIPLTHCYGDALYGSRVMKADLEYKYPERGEIFIYPTSLRPGADSNIKRGITLLTSNSVLVVEDTAVHTNPTLVRSMNIWGHRFHYRRTPQRIDTIYIGKGVRAYILGNYIPLTSIAGVETDNKQLQ